MFWLMSRKQSDSTLSTFPTSEFVRSYPDVSNQFRILFGRIVAVQMETDLRVKKAETNIGWRNSTNER